MGGGGGRNFEQKTSAHNTEPHAVLRDGHFLYSVDDCYRRETRSTTENRCVLWRMEADYKKGLMDGDASAVVRSVCGVCMARANDVACTNYAN